MTTTQIAPTRRYHSLVWLTRAGLLAVLVLAWELLSAAEGGLYLPSISAIAGALARLGVTGELWEAFFRTNQALLIGFPICVVVGVPLGLLLGRLRSLDRYVGFYLDMALVIPTIAIVPVIIVALGLSIQARVMVVVLFTLPVVAMNSRAAVRVLEKARIEMARSFEATWPQVWSKVILPEALGPIFAGLRLGLARAVSAMIVVELVLVPVGLGGFIVDFSSRFRAPEVYAITALIVAEGILVVAGARWLERRLYRRIQGGAA